MNKLPEQTVQKMISLYESGNTILEISKIIGFSDTTIRRIFQKRNLYKRHKNSKIKTLSKKETETIIDLYVNQKLGSLIIARKLNVNKIQILRCLRKNNINTNRPYSFYSSGKRKPRVEKEELENYYKTHRISETAIYFGVKHRGTLRSWLDFYGIKRRTRSEELRLIPCYLRSNWKGGITPLRNLIYCSLTEWKKSVLKRDGYKCTKCSSKKNLEIHHCKIPMRLLVSNFMLKFPNIDLSKQEDLNFAQKTIVNQHTEDMGITLCEKCHNEVDFYKPKKSSSGRK